MNDVVNPEKKNVCRFLSQRKVRATWEIIGRSVSGIGVF